MSEVEVVSKVGRLHSAKDELTGDDVILLLFEAGLKLKKNKGSQVLSSNNIQVKKETTFLFPIKFDNAVLNTC